MANYISSLTGPQMDDALMQMNNRIPEGWAVGTKDGTPVPSTSQFYHNNAKYYAERAKRDIQSGVDAANAAAERAEAAVPAGTNGAVFFDVEQNLMDWQKAQARKNIGAGASNPNLLTNPWFTVNQRGVTSGAARTNPADRWELSYGQLPGVSWERNADGSITIKDPDGNRAHCVQKLDDTLRDAMDGHIAYMSIMTGDGTIYGGAGLFDKTATRAFWIGDVEGTHVELLYRPDLFGVTVVAAAGNLTIKAVKLEPGGASTLGNDVPPDYAEELAKCQYYFRRLKAKGAQTDIGYAYGISASEAQLVLPFSMGEVKTVTYAGSISLMKSASHALSSAALNSQTDSTVCLSLGTSGIAGGDLYRVLIPTGDNYIDISAEL